MFFSKNLIIYYVCWVLAITHWTTQHFLWCLLWDALSMEGCEAILWKVCPWIIAGMFIFGKCQVLTLMSPYVDFIKEQAHCSRNKRLNFFRPFPSLHTFPVAIKSYCPLLPLFQYIFIFCSHPRYAWNK